MARTVHVVYVEYNKNEEPYVVGVGATREIAEQIHKAAVKQHRDEFGEDIYGDEEREGSDEDWDVDIHIEEFTVQEAI